jgi:glycosyltransferase involved in cell wall biosynthesis
VVEHGRTGFLVDTHAQLAQAIVEAGTLSSSLCRERAEREFSSTKMIRAYLSLYEELARTGDSVMPCWEEVA